jgi:hypothetical protein
MAQRFDGEASDEGGHNVVTNLMKFDLELEKEEEEPIQTYTLHYTEIDNPLYI